MITIKVFVLPSGSKKANFNEVAEACMDWASEINKVSGLREANEMMGNLIVPGTWNLILYDDEIPEPAFGRNIDQVLSETDKEAFVVYKRGKEQTPTKSPRIFKAGVAIRNDCTLPVRESIRVGNYMQGFLLGIAKYV